MICLTIRNDEGCSAVHDMLSNASSSLEIQGLISLLWRAMSHHTPPHHAGSLQYHPVGTQGGPYYLLMPSASLLAPLPSTGQ